jgi:hypothetical protein
MPTSEIDASNLDTGSLPKWSGQLQPYEYELFIGANGYSFYDSLNNSYYSFDKIQTNQMIFKLPENVVIADAPDPTPPPDSAVFYYYDPSVDEVKYAFFNRDYTGALPYRWTGRLTQGFINQPGFITSGTLEYNSLGDSEWVLKIFTSTALRVIYKSDSETDPSITSESYPWNYAENGELVFVSGFSNVQPYFVANEILSHYTKINDNTIRLDTNPDSLLPPLNNLYIRLSGVS